jgi:hypothetical protein
MLAGFWGAVGGKLADRFAAASAPALVFWLGGLLAWAYGHGGLHRLSTPPGWLSGQSAPLQVAALIGILAGVIATGVIVQRLTTPVLRLLEGYWPRWLAPLRRRLISHAQDRARADVDSVQSLASHVLPPADPNAATEEQRSAFARLDQRQRRRPQAPNRLQPTRIGNLLRAAEAWPRDKYGLDAVVVWPRLWLVLPDATRQELLAARGALDAAVAAVIWGTLFCLFTGWAPFALPIGLAVAIGAATAWVPARAAVFGDLVEAAFDLYRTALYQQLRWPVPTNPQQEHAQGERLTSYLWRGSSNPDPTFTQPL